MEKELSKIQYAALMEKWKRAVDAQQDFNWFMDFIKKELDVDDTWQFDQQTFKKFTKRDEKPEEVKP